MGHPEPVTTAVPPPKPKGRWRWFQRVALALFALMILGIGGYMLSWKLTRREGRQRVEAVNARLDANDPGWRFADIVADHNSKVPPAESNSALRAVGIVERLPKEPDPERSTASLFGKTRDGKLPNELPTPAEWKALDSLYKVHEPLIAELRTWNAATPRGRMLLDYPGRNPFDIRVDNSQKLRMVAFLLAWDSARSAYRGQADRALASDAAGLHFVRSVDFEPFLISYLIRLACIGVALNSVEQTLAWCANATEPALAAIQELIAKGNGDIRPALRFERAMMQQSLEMFDRGEIGLYDLKPTTQQRILRIHTDQFIPHNIAFVHARYDEFLTILDLPSAEKAAAIRDWKLPPRTNENHLGHLLLPAVSLVVLADLRVQARGLCVGVGVACERYRSKHGRWPKSLDELADFGFAKGPVDPFDGQPLRYRVEADGVIIYSVGKNGIDDGGNTHRREGAAEDVGCRLWNPARRRIKAPAPALIIEEPPAP